MATTVSMPQLGETVTEGTILSWAKQVGDTIAEDEVLVEISTDKVDTEVPSPAAGVILELLVAEGDTIAVGTAMAIIGEAGEASGAPAVPVEVEADTAEPEPPPTEEAPAPEPVAAPDPAPVAAASADGESTTVSMPQLGETVTEGTILSWMKQVGDTVAVDEVIVEISTDKVDTEVPSPVAGTVLEIVAAEGDTIAVGAPMVVIGATGSTPAPAPAAAPQEPAPPVEAAASPARQAPSPSPAPAVAAPASAAAAAAAPVPEGAFFSPVVRKLAKDHGVDLGKVTGTGREGRITRKDVEAYVAAHGSAPAPAPAPPSPVAAPAPAVAAAPTPSPAGPTASVAAADGVTTMEGDVVQDLNRIRSRIGENMIRSKETAAHVWTSVEVDFEHVERVRQAHKAAYKAREGHSLTYLPFIARATIDALNEFPVVNSSFYLEQKQAVYHSAINLGIAIDLNQEGLIVATVRNADGLRMVGLARSIRDLADRGRANQLSIDDLSGSTFTITNPGPFGSFMSAPIINVPNVAILSTDTVKKRPTVVTSGDGQDSIAIRHIAYLGLSWDHRAFDGSTAVLFLRRIKDNIETWDWEQELD